MRNPKARSRCRACGREFVRRRRSAPGVTTSTIYCSPHCRKAWLEGPGAPAPRQPEELRICAYCGGTFRFRPVASTTPNKGRFCSQECRVNDLWWVPRDSHQGVERDTISGEDDPQ